MFNLYLVIMRKRTFIIYNRSQRDSQPTSSIKEITYRYDQCGYYNLIDIARSSKRIIYYGILYKTDSCDAFCTFYSILFCRQCCSWIEQENSQLIGHYLYVIELTYNGNTPASVRFFFFKIKSYENIPSSADRHFVLTYEFEMRGR